MKLFYKLFVISVFTISLTIKGFTQNKAQYLTDTCFKTLAQAQAAFEADWKAQFNQTNSPSLDIHAENLNPNYRYNRKERKYIQFKRWEDQMFPRVYPSGDLSLPSSNFERMKEYRQIHPAKITSKNAKVGTTWSFVGPSGLADGKRNAGRMNFIHVDPVNNNILYAGAPAGGLWKSINGGTSWSPMSDHLPAIGCSDLAIDPTNNNVIYLLTGDNDGGDTQSIGVLKSTDGGVTWNTTGLTWTAGQYLHRVLWHTEHKITH